MRFARRSTLAMVAKHGGLTVEQLALARDRGESATRAHVRYLVRYGFLRAVKQARVRHPLIPGAWHRPPAVLEVTEAGARVLMGWANTWSQRRPQRTAVGEALERLGSATQARLSRETDLDAEAVLTALDEIQAVYSRRDRTWRLHESDK
jgi:hypothetical protein